MRFEKRNPIKTGLRLQHVISEKYAVNDTLLIDTRHQDFSEIDILEITTDEYNNKTARINIPITLNYVVIHKEINLFHEGLMIEHLKIYQYSKGVSNVIADKYKESIKKYDDITIERIHESWESKLNTDKDILHVKNNMFEQHTYTIYNAEDLVRYHDDDIDLPINFEFDDEWIENEYYEDSDTYKSFYDLKAVNGAWTEHVWLMAPEKLENENDIIIGNFAYLCDDTYKLASAACRCDHVLFKTRMFMDTFLDRFWYVEVIEYDKNGNMKQIVIDNICIKSDTIHSKEYKETRDKVLQYQKELRNRGYIDYDVNG